MNQQAHIDWTPVVVILTVLLLATAGTLLHCNIHCVGSADPHIMRMQDKASTLKWLNEMRTKTGRHVSPVGLIELDVARWRAEYLAKRGLFSPYDAVGRHPLYWYTRLDGGFYAVEEVFIPVEYYDTSPEVLEKASLREGMERVLSKRRDSLLNPCYNYIAMEASSRYLGGPQRFGWKFFVFYMVAKWVDWDSPPLYADGRFTAEGYADPSMKPVALVVYYASHERYPQLRNSYSLGDVYFCKYLDPPVGCKDAVELEGTFIVSKVLDSGRWYVKIDTLVQLDKPGLYTFEIIAEDLRAPNRRCPLMHYTVEVPPKK